MAHQATDLARNYGSISSSSEHAPAVPLRRSNVNSNGHTNTTAEPLWALTSHNDELAPLAAKCDKHNESRDVCCKTLKGDDERMLIDPDVVRDIIIGLSDGLTVPFALTAGLSSIGDSRIVVIGGVAELIAGAISMGIGGFLASQAERDHFYYLRKRTRHRVQRSCAGEMEREVHTVLGPVGVNEKISRQLADDLLALEDQQTREAIEYARTHPESVWNSDVGLTAFLLKFGEGMEEVPTARLYISAFTIGMGYFIGGLIPLLPYFFINVAQVALIYSCIITGIVLLIFGAIKQHFTGGKGGFSGYAWGAFSTLFVGGVAAGAAFAIVRALEA
ncbi:VIT family-domain-containing protein [Cantharellus anzutake]|uniref:VIT family-domain-containing protein n=1 Tax=Cantharellus anzutake TaxID=1750568 RepID=UPI001908ACEF|nr:VIT family-domain-containing protein [Cantharellus anzutake]KAF8327577.1 VIT family-domain-containing protein [Cantharellus anzutake]